MVQYCTKTIKFAILSMAMLFAPPVGIFAQKVKTVVGEYTYYVPETVSREEAKKIALERAMIQALADEFGTIVSQFNITQTENRNGHSQIDFTSIGGSDTKGEWIETIGEPIYETKYEGDVLIITVKVKGRAREIATATIDFKARLLRNSTEDKFESDQFNSGDDLYMSFTSPVSGYLAVYLIDADGQANCLLPYINQQSGVYPIVANRRYLFFNAKEAAKEERSYVDEYVLQCERGSENNQVYVIFSPNKFAKAADKSVNDALPRQLDVESFRKWLAGCRKRDADMNVRMMMIGIRKDG